LAKNPLVLHIIAAAITNNRPRQTEDKPDESGPDTTAFNGEALGLIERYSSKGAVKT
jgi:hypothetical protein